MPVMRWSVVCALRDVILTFWPTSAFISVDLPTLGRPTIATMPQRKSVGVGAFIFGLRQVQIDARKWRADGNQWPASATRVCTASATPGSCSAGAGAPGVDTVAPDVVASRPRGLSAPRGDAVSALISDRASAADLSLT